MPCLGNKDEHCCYVNGSACLYLEENTVEGRRWACGLRRTLGNWDDVITSPEYLVNVEPHFRQFGMNCKDWPDGTGANSYICVECGSVLR
jgi:hypothetical protein